jgi:hypothetical protein
VVLARGNDIVTKRRGPTGSDSLAAIACGAAGIVIAALPHFIAWSRVDRLDRVSSIDDRFYPEVASQAYFNHPKRVADLVRVSGSPTLHRS